jgi:hypothetical protein
MGSGLDAIVCCSPVVNAATLSTPCMNQVRFLELGKHEEPVGDAREEVEHRRSTHVERTPCRHTRDDRHCCAGWMLTDGRHTEELDDKRALCECAVHDMVKGHYLSNGKTCQLNSNRHSKT